MLRPIKIAKTAAGACGQTAALLHCCTATLLRLKLLFAIGYWFKSILITHQLVVVE